jgi:hypothetical protein
MSRLAIAGGVFLIATVCLFGLISVSVRYNEIANRSGVKACFTTGCSDAR